jgi:dihydrofolate reductase
MHLSLIVAISQNHIIGRGGRLPWRLPADLKRFKQLTMGHHLIMGRKTFESIGRVLPGRTTVVLTRSARAFPPGVVAVSGLAEALAVARHDSQAFVVGGAELYRQALPVADRIYLTRVHADVDGDTRFDLQLDASWRMICDERFPADAANQHAYSFQVLERLAGPHTLSSAGR